MYVYCPLTCLQETQFLSAVPVSSPLTMISDAVQRPLRAIRISTSSVLQNAFSQKTKNSIQPSTQQMGYAYRWDVLGPAALLSVDSVLDEQLPSSSRSHGYIIIPQSWPHHHRCILHSVGTKALLASPLLPVVLLCRVGLRRLACCLLAFRYSYQRVK